jgi:hypothetical protein
MPLEALGMVETKGFVGAVEALTRWSKQRMFNSRKRIYRRRLRDDILCAATLARLRRPPTPARQRRVGSAN